MWASLCIVMYATKFSFFEVISTFRHSFRNVSENDDLHSGPISHTPQGSLATRLLFVYPDSLYLAYTPQGDVVRIP